jgi:6-pyruvoyltetrahydropterin/6-carboxytetrahydropterin synthase
VYEVSIKKSFSAAHTLKDIGGTCEQLHGHNFIVEASVSSHKLSDSGILIDFSVLHEWTDEILQELDHKHLNETPFFNVLNPSAENIAKFIYERLLEKARSHDINVDRVTVWESEDTKASYTGNLR